MNNGEIHEKWRQWVHNRGQLYGRLHKEYLRESDHFSATHAVAEAALRRIIFIGLRANRVTYKSARLWLEHNPLLFGKKQRGHNFNYCFDKLYEVSWSNILRSQDGLAELWELWTDYAKPIRNHLAHAQRNHNEETLDTSLAINELFLMRLDKAMKPIVGGSPFSHLHNLSPRLPPGDGTITPGDLLDLPTRVPSPLISHDDARTRLAAI